MSRRSIVLLNAAFLLSSPLLAGDRFPDWRFDPGTILESAREDCTALLKVSSLGNTFEVRLPRGRAVVGELSSYIALPDHGGTWENLGIPRLAQIVAIRFDQERNPYFLVKRIYEDGMRDDLYRAPDPILPSRLVDALPTVEALRATNLTRKQNFVRTPFLFFEENKLRLMEFSPDLFPGEKQGMALFSKLVPFEIKSVDEAWPEELFSMSAQNPFLAHRQYVWLISENGRLRLAPLSIASVSIRSLAAGEKVLAAGQLSLAYIPDEIEGNQFYLHTIRVDFKNFGVVTPHIRSAVTRVFSGVFFSEAKHLPLLVVYIKRARHYGIEVPLPQVIIE